MVAQHIGLLAADCGDCTHRPVEQNIFGFVWKPSCAHTRAMAHAALKGADNRNWKHKTLSRPWNWSKRKKGLEPVVISTRPCSQQNAALYLAAFDRLCNCLPGLVAIACAELETRAMWDQPSGWCLCCPSLPEGEAAEVIPEGCEAGKRGLGMASHHLQLLGKVPLYISARHLNQGKGGAMTLLHASALCDFCVSKTEWPLMEVWRLVPLLKLLSSPQEPWLGCNCCSTSHHEPE